jgi:hypothetical protein
MDLYFLVDPVCQPTLLLPAPLPACSTTRREATAEEGGTPRGSRGWCGLRSLHPQQRHPSSSHPPPARFPARTMMEALPADLVFSSISMRSAARDDGHGLDGEGVTPRRRRPTPVGRGMAAHRGRRRSACCCAACHCRGRGGARRRHRGRGSATSAGASPCAPSGSASPTPRTASPASTCRCRMTTRKRARALRTAHCAPGLPCSRAWRAATRRETGRGCSCVAAPLVFTRIRLRSAGARHPDDGLGRRLHHPRHPSRRREMSHRALAARVGPGRCSSSSCRCDELAALRNLRDGLLPM